jgi:hypothetical protein
MLIPDQGTIPMRWSTDRRAQGLKEVENEVLVNLLELELEVEVPGGTLRVRAIAEGKK